MFRPPTPQPRHRYLKIHRHLRQSGHYATDVPLEDAVVRLLQGDTSVPEEVLRAYGIFWDRYKREVVEAFLLAEAKPKDLNAVFNIRENVIEVYQEVFFDTSVFFDRLDAETYARKYSEDDFGQELKVSAVEDGLEYLKARFGRGHYHVSPTQAIRELISQAYINSKVANKYPLDNPKTKEALRWAGTLPRNIDTLITAQEIEGGKKASYIFKLQLLQDRDEEEMGVEEDPPEINPEDIVNRRTES